MATTTFKIKTLNSGTNKIGWYGTYDEIGSAATLEFSPVTFNAATGENSSSIRITSAKLTLNFQKAGVGRQKTFKLKLGNQILTKTTAGVAYEGETFIDFTSSDLTVIKEWIDSPDNLVIKIYDSNTSKDSAWDGGYSQNYSRLISSSTTAATLTLTYEYAAASLRYNSSYTLGNSSSLTILNLGSNTATVTLTSGTTTQTLATKTSSTSLSFTPAISTFGPLLGSTSTSLSAKLVIETFSGSTSIGKKEYNISLKTADNTNFKPYISNIALGEKTTLGSISVYVANHSSATFTASCSSKYNATIKSYKWIFPDGTTEETTTNSCTKNFTSGFSSKTISLTITDSRGYTTSGTTSAITVYAYSPPSITNFSVSRANSSGTVLDTGTSLKVTALTFSGTNKISTFTNTYTETYKINGTSVSKNTTTGLLGSTTVNIDTSANVEVTITDSLGGKAIKTFKVPAFAYLLHFGKNRKSIGIGTAAPSSEEISLGLKANFYQGALSAGEGGTGATSYSGAFTNIVAPGGTITGPLTLNGRLYSNEQADFTSAVISSGLFIKNGDYSVYLSLRPTHFTSVTGGEIRYTLGSAYKNSRIYFSERSVSSTEDKYTSFYENYYLPGAKTDLTANIDYRILTTKECTILSENDVYIMPNTTLSSTTQNIFHGQLTGSGKKLYLNIPFYKNLSKINSVTVTTLKGLIRSQGGYALGSGASDSSAFVSFLAQKGDTATTQQVIIDKISNSLCIILMYGSSLGSSYNNAPCSALISEMSFTFT